MEKCNFLETNQHGELALGICLPAWKITKFDSNLKLHIYLPSSNESLI